jgi:hypothetical protein
MSRLNVSLSASVASWTKGLNKAAKDLEKFVGVSKGTIDKLIGTVPKIAAAFGGVGLAAGLKMAATRMDELAKASSRLGITSEQLAGLQHAADLGGSSADGMTKALEKLSVKQYDALAGNKKLRDQFAQFGITIEDLQKNDVAGLMSRIADGMKDAGSSGEKMAFAMDTFGKDTGILSVLQDGSEGLKKMSDEAKLLGLSVSEIDGKRIQEMNDSVSKIGSAMNGAFNQLIVEIAPAVKAIADGFVNWIVQMGGAKVIARSITNTFLDVFGYLASLGNKIVYVFQMVKEGLAGIASGLTPILDFINFVSTDESAIKRLELSIETKARRMNELHQEAIGYSDKERDRRIQIHNESIRLARDEANNAQTTNQIMLDRMESVRDNIRKLNAGEIKPDSVFNVAGLEKTLEDLRVKAGEYRRRENDLRETANRLETSNWLKEWDDARAKNLAASKQTAEEMNREMARLQKGKTGNIFDTDAIRNELTKAMEDAQKKQEELGGKDPMAEVQKYKESLDAQRRLDDEKAIADKAREDKKAADVLTRQQNLDAELEKQREKARHDSSLMGILEQEEEKRKRESYWATTKSYIGSLNASTATLAKTSKTWFNINKGLSSATVVMRTSEAVMGAWSWGIKFGPVAASVAAGLAAAAGAAELLAINSMSYGGSGSVSGGGGGGGGDVSAAAATSNVGAPRQQSQEIIIYGDTVSTDQLMRMTEQARERGVTLGGFRRG